MRVGVVGVGVRVRATGGDLAYLFLIDENDVRCHYEHEEIITT